MNLKGLMFVLAVYDFYKKYLAFPVLVPKILFFLFNYCSLSEHFPLLAFKVILTLVSVSMKGFLKEIPAMSLKITRGTFLSFLK